MAVILSLPEGYSLVALGCLFTVFVLAGQSNIVHKYRKASKIPYPQLYAEKAEAESNPVAKKFNCAQRVHHNTLETVPFALVNATMVGLKYPYFAGPALITWSLSRIGYTYGYLQSPAKRNSYSGIVGPIALSAIFVTNIYVVGSWVCEEFM